VGGVTSYYNISWIHHMTSSTHTMLPSCLTWPDLFIPVRGLVEGCLVKRHRSCK